MLEPSTSAAHLLIGDAARQPLATETAIGGDDEPLRRDVVVCLSDQVRHVLGSYKRQDLNPRSAGVVASGVNNCFLSTGLTGQAKRERQLATCAVTRRRFSSGCKPRPAIAPAGSNRGRHGGDEMSEALG